MTSPVTCADPGFTWIEEHQHWSACTQCGRLAWAHEQADPLADIRNVVRNLGTGLHSLPAMRQTKEPKE